MPHCQICAIPPDDHEWFVKDDDRSNWGKELDSVLQENWEMPSTVALVSAAPAPVTDIEAQFNELAAMWSKRTKHVSSATDLVSDPAYQGIIDLGWEVVPYLLVDLQKNKRFWFPALHAITNIRPFDPRDAGNSRRMTDAWIRWGKRKNLV